MKRELVAWARFLAIAFPLVLVVSYLEVTGLVDRRWTFPVAMAIGVLCEAQTGAFGLSWRRVTER